MADSEESTRVLLYREKTPRSLESLLEKTICMQDLKKLSL